MFSYFRNDILPISDLGIRKGLSKLYGRNEFDEQFIHQLKTKLGKYATLFSFCL
jgi:3-methyladenine DNA glycosylase/8-oxoguanine DNA glycosylase